MYVCMYNEENYNYTPKQAHVLHYNYNKNIIVHTACFLSV